MADDRSHQTVSEALLSRLRQDGVDWLFGNAGTDFAPIIEALAGADHSGLDSPTAVPITHETVAIGMAHGYYLATGRPQAVMVHVNVGLANTLMGVINASRENIPVVLMSGRTPITEDGRMGSRSIPIHWGQEMFDQGSMLREFVKWDYEIRFGEQVIDIVDRALAIAQSEPCGPVYLSLPRELLAESVAPASKGPAPATPSAPGPDPESVAAAAALLSEAKRPLVITTRSDEAICAAVARFAEQLEVPVVQFWPARLSLPTNHPQHAGFDVGKRLAAADVVLVLDAAVPWVPMQHHAPDDCQVIQVGPDPAFAAFPIRGFPSALSITSRVDTFLDALAAELPGLPAADAFINDPSPSSPIGWLERCINEAKDDDTILVNELGCDTSKLSFGRTDSFYGAPISGGLGFALPAALGIQLAEPDRLVMATIGDGSYIFSNPVACHHTAAALDLPVLTVVANNRVWDAVRKAASAMYPEGHAVTAADMPLTSLEPSPNYAAVIEACGGYGERVDDPDDLPAAFERALKAVSESRQALLDVRCDPA